MTPRLHRLAFHLVASPFWTWVPGMLGVEREPLPRQRWAPADQGPIFRRVRVGDYSPLLATTMMARCVPDLDDPATLGSLVALVRRAWNEPDLVVAPRELWTPIPFPVVSNRGPLWDARWVVAGDGWCTLGMAEGEPLAVALLGALRWEG